MRKLLLLLLCTVGCGRSVAAPPMCAVAPQDVAVVNAVTGDAASAASLAWLVPCED